MLSSSKAIRLIPIKEMDRALKFYTDALGGKLVMRGEGDMKDSWASLTVGNSEFWLTAPEKRETMELAYTAFLVDNIEAAVKGLVEKGVKFDEAEDMGPETKVDGPIATAPWGARSAFFKDSEGNLLMLWQQSMG